QSTKIGDLARLDCQFDVPRNLIAHVTPGSPWETVILVNQTATRTAASLHRPITSNGIPPLGRKSYLRHRMRPVPSNRLKVKSTHKRCQYDGGLDHSESCSDADTWSAAERQKGIA